MARSNLLRQYQLITSRPSRRNVSTTSGSRTSTSPQRRGPCINIKPASTLKTFNDIPGPLAMPMLRHSAHVLPRIGSFHHVVGLGLLEGLRNKYGDLVRLAKGSRTRPVFYVFDPELMREVYESRNTEPPLWDRSPLTQQRKKDAKQCPIQGDESKAIWLVLRALLLDSSLLKNYEQALDDIAADATRRLGELRHAENALNEELETEVYRWALESLGMIVFGTRLGCLDGPAHIPTPENRSPEKTSMEDDTPDLCSLFKKAMEELTPAEQLVRTSMEIADNGYLVRSENTLKRDSHVFENALKAFDRHFSLIEQILIKEVVKLNTGDDRPEKILLDKLRPLKHRLLPVTADMMLSGVDPLAQTALSMFHQLSLNAARQQRAHDEVAWSIASKNVGAICPELPYIAGCAKEALRLHPATGGVVRRSKEDMIVAGYEVPAGVDIVLAHGVSSKSEKEWGRSNAFIPERWCPGRGPLHASRAHPFSSLPFGESCPAEGVVEKILESLISRVLDKYRLEWHGPPPSLVMTGVNKIKRPFYFVLQNAA